jgi:hypothetical protein
LYTDAIVSAYASFDIVSHRSLLARYTSFSNDLLTGVFLYAMSLCTVVYHMTVNRHSVVAVDELLLVLIYLF